MASINPISSKCRCCLLQLEDDQFEYFKNGNRHTKCKNCHFCKRPLTCKRWSLNYREVIYSGYKLLEQINERLITENALLKLHIKCSPNGEIALQALEDFKRMEKSTTIGSSCEIVPCKL